MKRTPESKRADRSAEVVQARHCAILALWKADWDGNIIAQVVGLKNAATVYYHINERCGCRGKASA